MRLGHRRPDRRRVDHPGTRRPDESGADHDDVGRQRRHGERALSRPALSLLDGIEPASFPRLAQLTDGRLILLRAPDRGDRDAICRLSVTCFDGFARLRRVPGWTVGPLHRILEIAEGRRTTGAAVLAVDAHTGAVIGLAVCETAGVRAKVSPAFIISSRMRRQAGLATAMLERLAQIARLGGVERFSAHARAWDPRMFELITRVGGDIRRVEGLGDDAVEITVPLAGDDTLGVPLGAALWSVARGGLVPIRIDDNGRPR